MSVRPHESTKISNTSDGTEVARKLIVEVIGFRGVTHTNDVTLLRAAGWALPHQYTDWPLSDSQHTWYWVRVTDIDQKLLSAFSLALSWSRAVPGTRIARIYRFGRDLHEPILGQLNEILQSISDHFIALQRIDIQVWDENPQTLGMTCDAIETAGAKLVHPPREYSHTILIPIDLEEHALLATFSSSTRRQIRNCQRRRAIVVKTIIDYAYSHRMQQLIGMAFSRTGGGKPTLSLTDIIKDSRAGRSSVLLGAFDSEHAGPEGLLSFVWGRYHGDVVSYDLAASDRTTRMGNTSLGHTLVLHLAQWASTRGARWIDLGGVPLPGASSERLDGITRFKRGFSRDVQLVSVEYSFVCSPHLARIADALRRLLRSLHRNVQ